MLTCNDLRRMLLRIEAERRIPLREIDKLHRDVARIATLARQRDPVYQANREMGVLAARAKQARARASP